MTEVLEKTKAIIFNQVQKNRIMVSGEPFKDVQKAYFWTNENVTALMEHADIPNISQALTVLASGDQLFSLISEGVKNIDTFDINQFTEYYALGLKMAIILKNDYAGFIQTINTLLNSNNMTEIMTILYDLLPFMEEKYRDFWQSLLDYTFKIQKQAGTNLNIMQMLFLQNMYKNVFKGTSYTKNAAEYQNFKNNLTKSNINFTHADILELAQKYSVEFDLIILSNILDYMISCWGYGWNYEKLKEYVTKLSSILSPSGTIFLNYIFDQVSNFGYERTTLFLSSSVKKTDLTTEEVIQIPSINNNTQDGLILARNLVR